jgi:hypothetical protein
MKDNAGLITSVFRVNVGALVWFINPTNQSGTQTITVSGIPADGLTKVLDVTCIPS